MLKFLLKYLLLLFLLLQSSDAEVLWANRVSGFSSQAGDKQFSAQQIIGKPSVLSGYGSSPCAWKPEKREEKQSEWIKVKFMKSLQVKQICIVENFNPGAVKKVILIDTNGNDHIVMNNPERSNNCESGTFNMSIEKTSYFVNEVKLELTFDSTKVPQIDAMSISDDNNLIIWDIDLVQDYKKYSQPENLGPEINSKFSEIAPLISNDSKLFFFTRDNYPENLGPVYKQDVWVSGIDIKGHFSKAVNLGMPVNNTFNNSAFSITPDGKRLYLINIYRGDGIVNKGISYSDFKDQKWNEPQGLIIRNYKNDNSNAGYFISNDGQYLLLSIEDDKSVGGLDLYVSYKINGTEWTSPINLGLIINSADDEITPFLDSDNITLYFSSKGHCGYGSQDIFVSTRMDETWRNWSKPKNLGPIINSSLWDAYFKYSPDRKFIYFSSFNNSKGEADIFKSDILDKSIVPKLISIRGIVKDELSGSPVESEIIIKRINSKEVIKKVKSDNKSGEYRLNFELSGQFFLEVLKSEYLPITETFDLSSSDSNIFRRNYNISKVLLDSVYRFNNIIFPFAEFKINNSQTNELESIISYLNNNKNLKIIILGNTDDVGTDDDNYQLSLKRANSVSTYLEKHGIDISRITIKGLGKTKPLKPNTTEANRELNRRVEYIFHN